MNRKFFLAGAVFSVVAAAGVVYAQAPASQPIIEFTVKVSPQELDLIGNGLGSMPFKDAAPLINKLREQVLAQTKQPDAPKVEEKK